MVGRLALGKLQQRLNHVTSHGSGDRVSFNKLDLVDYTRHKNHVPFIASPLDPRVTDWLNNKRDRGNFTLKGRHTVAIHEAHKIAEGGLFRKQHEASPLELYFDLFFVANLAVFTYNHSQADGMAVGSYVGFFTIIWTFWFHVSIYDVRFYVDSVLNRFFKLAQFVMFTSFIALGGVYDVLANGGVTRAFHGLALVLMLNRIILMIQYASVLWSVRAFKKTLVPLVLMIVIYLCAAMAFLGTYLYDTSGNHAADSDQVRLVTVWYCIMAIEAVAVVLVSSVWRVLSFKHTHLVERAGLLTLIVMGEGIIGICKSIAYVLDGTALSIWDATGRVITGVFLIYLIYVLYFTPIAHDRFGTVRQQVWILLHLPLHVAIVLCEEGSAATLLWTAVMGAVGALETNLPPLINPATKYADLSAFVAGVNQTMVDVSNTYTYVKLKDLYDWYPDIYKLKNISAIYGSDSFNDQASYILSGMINNTSNYFFYNFHFDAPEEIKYISDTSQKLDLYESAMVTIFTYFYIASGFVLLILAAMFWIGKNNKTWEEYVSIGARTLVGLALPLITIAAWTQTDNETAFMYQESGWIVAIVVWCFFFITIADNTVASIYDRRYLKKASNGDIEAGKVEDLHKHRYNGAYGPHSHSPNHSSAEIPTIQSTSPTHKGIKFTETPAANSRPDGIDRSHSEESHAINSDGTTLSGRHDSEQIHKAESLTVPPTNQRDWQSQPTYYLPPLHLSRDNSYRRVNGTDTDTDTEYHGNTDTTLYAEQADRFRNDKSFENERMMSPTTWTGSRLERPEEGHLPSHTGHAL